MRPLGVWAACGGGSQVLLLLVRLHLDNEEAREAVLVLQESIPLRERPGCSSLRSRGSHPPASLAQPSLQPRFPALWAALCGTRDAELAHLDSPAPFGGGGNRKERPGVRDPGFLSTRAGSRRHCHSPPCHGPFCHSPQKVPGRRGWLQQAQMLTGGDFCPAVFRDVAT